jgi:hypothetical protein
MTVEVSRISERYVAERPLWKAGGVIFAAATRLEVIETMKVLFPRTHWKGFFPHWLPNA